MIARLGPGNILYQIGFQALSSPISFAGSWFLQVREICTNYFLLDPISILSNPPTKLSFKKLSKQKVLNHWNSKLRLSVASLPSLNLFQADFMSLSQPHPIWTSAGSSPYEVRKATVQARMLSGRYRTCVLAQETLVW